MRNWQAVVGGTLLSVLVAGCATSLTKDIEVVTETVAGTDVRAYSSYTWLASAEILNDPDGQWEPRGFDADAEIRFLVNRELRSHGFTEVSANPDMLLAYMAGVDMAALELEKDPSTQLEVLRRDPKGALLVMFLNARTGDAIWGGLAEANVQGQANAEDARQRLDYAVTRMFSELPK